MNLTTTIKWRVNPTTVRSGESYRGFPKCRGEIPHFVQHTVYGYSAICDDLHTNGPTTMRPQKTKMKHKESSFPCQTFLYFLFCMCPAMGLRKKTKKNKEHENGTETRVPRLLNWTEYAACKKYIRCAYTGIHIHILLHTLVDVNACKVSHNFV